MKDLKVKIIAGIDNYDTEKVLKVAKAAQAGGADAVDIAADAELIAMVKENCSIPVFVSSIEPEKLLMAKENGADALEIGNFDALYKKGMRITAEEVLQITRETIALVGSELPLSVTVPGHINIAEQVTLAIELEELGVDYIQTEGAATVEATSAGARGLMEKAIVSIANTVELSKNVSTKIITASGITSTTAPMAIAAGAAAVGVGACVNRLNSEFEMIITVKSIVEAVNSANTRTEALA